MDLRGKKSLLVYNYSNLPNFSTHENIFCWLLQLVQIRLRRVEILIRFVFLYLRIRAEFSKRLRKVSLNKGMLKCKTFIPTLSKLTRTCRRVLLWSPANQTYLSTQTLIRSSGRFLFYRHSSHELTRPNRRFPFSVVACADQTVSYLRHSPHKITCPYKKMFTFLCRRLHRLTR